MTNKTVSVLIPAFNEEENISQTVAAVKEIPEVYEVLVVDDCSSDKTAEKAFKAGARVMTLNHNLGKGGAMNKGITGLSGDIVALIDGDLGSSAIDLKKLLVPVLAGEADMSIARFPRYGQKAGFGLVKELARRGIRLFTGLNVLAPLSGQRVVHRKVIEGLGEFEGGYGVEVGMTIDAFRRGFRIVEVDVNMEHAGLGRNLKGFIHRGKQFVDVAQVLVSRLRMR